jgi:O-methyltransferase domain
MIGKARGDVAAILEAYDFSRFRSIADVGGGRGHLLEAILERNPNARGVLFDLPHVIEEARGSVTARMSLHAGDFFRDALPSCDAYVLMDVIHDWDDERSARILSGIRAAAPPDATLLLLETIVPDEPGPHWGKTLDVLMLAVTGGLQRTADQFGELLRGSGFHMERVIKTATWMSIVEASAA